MYVTTLLMIDLNVCKKVEKMCFEVVKKWENNGLLFIAKSGQERPRTTDPLKGFRPLYNLVPWVPDIKSKKSFFKSFQDITKSY